MNSQRSNSGAWALVCAQPVLHVVGRPKGAGKVLHEGVH